MTRETRRKYRRVARGEKTKILDEFTGLTEYNRKYALQLLKGTVKVRHRRRASSMPRGHPRVYVRAMLAVLKRLLAFSSISHAGYAMIGVVAFNQLGATSVVFYLAAYIATNLLAFGIVMAFNRITGLEEISRRVVLNSWADRSDSSSFLISDISIKLPTAVLFP